jgi:hypothetical protein
LICVEKSSLGSRSFQDDPPAKSALLVAEGAPKTLEKNGPAEKSRAHESLARLLLCFEDHLPGPGVKGHGIVRVKDPPFAAFPSPTLGQPIVVIGPVAIFVDSRPMSDAVLHSNTVAHHNSRLLHPTQLLTINIST